MKIAVVMPAWNEEEGIGEFLEELDRALAPLDRCFIVVDDCSLDSTDVEVKSAAARGIPVTLVRNDTNLGHGPSTVRALGLGLTSGAELVVAVDGDGQFLGEDVARIVHTLETTNAQIVEGVRTQRQDPGYRRLVTRSTQVLVWSRTRRWPLDANTPLRGYRRESLRELLALVPPSSRIPNLLMSANCRLGPSLVEVNVRSIPRRGTLSTGSTWGASRRQLPNRRFLSFCYRAAGDWFKRG